MEFKSVALISPCTTELLDKFWSTYFFWKKKLLTEPDFPCIVQELKDVVVSTRGKVNESGSAIVALWDPGMMPLESQILLKIEWI